MNVKASVALAVLAVSTVGISACASSVSKGGNAAAPGAGGSTSATAPATPATSTPQGTPTTSASTDASATPTTGTTPLHTNVPDAAMLNLPDLAPPRDGSWKSNSVGQTVSAAQIIDPDDCDPVARPQYVDPNYPVNKAWATMRNVTWSSASNAQVSESVLTYTSTAVAADDFAKHRGWIAGCAVHFQWTDQPAKFSVSNVHLNGVADAYAIRVAMYPPDQPASTAGSQGYVYMTVMLRGNSLTVLTVSESGTGGAKPQEPALSAVQHDVQVAAAKVGKAFPSGQH
ncbi:hypothetical protein [Catenulispora rubra]|uniref:hypothetical protein n=1 Tax=Catenulispora rubra TaxID=280293 RepID=UPI001891F42F|nr:hypothetical protein [Catenulispora rubra]